MWSDRSGRAAGRVGVFMRVYRYEESIFQSIESILGQTYENLRFYVLVGGETQEAVRGYADRDDRIRILTVKEEDRDRVGFVTFMYDIADENDYVCTIDADDRYAPDFLEKAVAFARENGAEVVCCGSEILVQNGGERSQRAIQSDLIWENSRFPQVFPQVLQFFRPLWGKIYAKEVFVPGLDEKLPSAETRGGYGGDTILSLLLAGQAQKLGVMQGICHYYTSSPASGSKKILPGRLDADGILHRFLYDFLSGYGEIPLDTLIFIYSVYGHGLLDTIWLIVRSERDQDWIVKALEYILVQKEAREFFDAYDGMGLGKDVYNLLFLKMEARWVPQYPRECYHIFCALSGKRGREVSYEEFCLMGAEPSLYRDWLEEDCGALFTGLLEMSSGLSGTESARCFRFMSRLTDNALLKKILNWENVSGLLSARPDILTDLRREDYQAAQEEIAAALEEEPDGPCAERLIEVYSDICALISDVPGYVQSKVLLMALYDRLGREEDCLKVYGELVEMGIIDEDDCGEEAEPTEEREDE